MEQECRLFRAFAERAFLQSLRQSTWLHKARSLPKEEFKREVEKHLTGKEAEAYEIVYLKFYKSQLPIIEQALKPPRSCWAQINREPTV
jgi:hypothetical protein